LFITKTYIRLFHKMQLLLQLLVNGIIKGAIYAIVAFGLAIIYRGMRVFHIAHGAVYVISCYLFYTFFHLLNLPLSLAVFFTFVVVAIIAVCIELGVYKPLFKKEASSEIILIVSLALYVLIVNIIALFYGNETKMIFSEISSAITFSGIVMTHIQLIQLIISLLAFTGIYLMIKQTNIGRAITAMADNNFLAEVIGIDIWRLRMIMITIGSLLAAIAGILVSSDVGMDPWSGMSMLLAGAVAMIIGGVEKWEGALVGGLLLGILQALAIWKLSARWQDTVTFLVLFIFLLFKPEGILSSKKRV